VGAAEILSIGPEGPTLALQTLMALDKEPRESVGFLVFFKLGVWTTGFHDDDPAQLSLGAFASGLFADMRHSPVWRDAP